jgi:hypothetical protein
MLTVVIAIPSPNPSNMPAQLPGLFAPERLGESEIGAMTESETVFLSAELLSSASENPLYAKIFTPPEQNSHYFNCIYSNPKSVMRKTRRGLGTASP